MQRLATLLGFEDARRRAWIQCAFSCVMTAVFFLLFSLKGPLNNWVLLEERWMRLVVLGVFAAMLLGVLLYLSLWKRWEWPTFLFVAMLVAVALYMRMAVMDVRTADYMNFLVEWVQTFREQGFSAITQDVGDYNLPYMYILAMIAKVPVHDLYIVKLVSILFDLLLALLMMGMVGRFLNKRYEVLTLSIVLLIPTVWFNGAYWAQCDAIYVFFTIACLYAMLADRPVLSVAMLTVAFSFKLQTIFFFPMVLFGLYFKKYKIRHALVFPVVYLLMILPALLMGRSLISTLMIYLNQASQYNSRLTYNAPNIYQLFPDVEVGYTNEWNLLKYIPGTESTDLDWMYTLDMMRGISQALIPFAAVIVVAVIYYLFQNRKYLDYSMVWMLVLLSTLLLPMILPKMHERYFALADMFAILYGLRYRKRFYVPVLVISSSFFSYYPFLFRFKHIDTRLVALLMIAATLIVLWDLFQAIRTAKKNDPQCDPQEIEPTYTI